MDKQLIERIAPLVQAALEQDYLFPAQGGRKSLSEAITAIVIESIDAERGRPALGYDAIFKSIASATKAPGAPAGIEVSVRAFKEAIGGEIFLSPTIPEGMVMVDKKLLSTTIKLTKEASETEFNRQPLSDELYGVSLMLAAAQGERK